MTHQLVRLEGGPCDGEMLGVNPIQQRLIIETSRGEHHYAEGEWGRETSPPIVTRLADFAVYTRTDHDTFRYEEAA